MAPTTMRRLASRLRIRGVVLPTLDIRLPVSGRHQLHGVPEFCQFARPMMRRRAGFYPDQAGFETRKERKHLGPSETLANNCHTSRIDSVKLKNSLGNRTLDFCARRLQGKQLGIWRPPPRRAALP